MKMRVICVWLLVCVIGIGQAYPDYVSDPAWLNVVNLPVYTDISVKTKGGKYQGYVEQTGEDYLLIMSSEKSMMGRGRQLISRKLTKDQILEVRLNKRMLSGLAGGGIGAGAGIAAGLIAGSRVENKEMNGLVTFVAGFVFGLIGAAVGYNFPFVKGEKIYSKTKEKN